MLSKVGVETVPLSFHKKKRYEERLIVSSKRSMQENAVTKACIMHSSCKNN